MGGLLKIGRKGEPKADASVEDSAIKPKNRDELGISDEAAQHIRALLQEKGEPNLILRVAVRGGGCSGLSIHYEFTEQARDGDHRFSNGAIDVIIDKKSLGVLGGATLHIRDYLGSKSFILVNNPNAKQCSCGQSFSL